MIERLAVFWEYASFAVVAALTWLSASFVCCPQVSVKFVCLPLRSDTPGQHPLRR